jgi:hypothetical protein
MNKKLYLTIWLFCSFSTDARINLVKFMKNYLLDKGHNTESVEFICKIIRECNLPCRLDGRCYCGNQIENINLWIINKKIQIDEELKKDFLKFFDNH